MTSETCAVPLAMRLHGYPTVVVDGRAAPMPLKHGLALLAYLADGQDRAGRDTLAALLWPDAPPGVGRTRLRRLVHALHERVGCTLVYADHDALWLDAAVRSDLFDTERAMARVLLGHALDVSALVPLLAPSASQVLAGFALDSEAFEDWLEQRRRVQHARLTRALQRAVALARTANDDEVLQAAALALLRLEPLHALPLAA